MTEKREGSVLYRVFRSTVPSALVCCALALMFYLFTSGIPLVNAPRAQDVTQVTVRDLRTDSNPVVYTDAETISEAVKMLNMLNWKPGRADGSAGEIALVFTLADGTEQTVSAGETMVFWQGKAHRLMQSGVFVNVAKNLLL